MRKINQLSEKQINFILSTAHDGGVNIKTTLDSEFLVLQEANKNTREFIKQISRNLLAELCNFF